MRARRRTSRSDPRDAPLPEDRGAGRAPEDPLHDLRHTHATLALGAGVHPKIVSERLGHSTIAFTLDVYSHAIPHMQAAAEEIARLVDGGDPDALEVKSLHE